jgi:transketolase
MASLPRLIIGVKHQPASLALSRQALPIFNRTRYASATSIARGACAPERHTEDRQKPWIVSAAGDQAASIITRFLSLRLRVI